METESQNTTTETAIEKIPQEKTGPAAYSRWQVFLGSFVGGPFTAIYLLKKNFDTLGNKDFADKTIKYGIVATILMFVTLPFIPDFVPSIAYSLAYGFMAQSFYDQLQKESLKDNPRHSHWNVAGRVALGLLAFILVAIPISMLFEVMGLWD